VEFPVNELNELWLLTDDHEFIASAPATRAAVVLALEGLGTWAAMVSSSAVAGGVSGDNESDSVLVTSLVEELEEIVARIKNGEG